MRVAKQFFDSPGSWLASNLCSSRPKTSGIVWLDVPPPFPRRESGESRRTPNSLDGKKMKRRAESMRKLSRTGNNSNNSDFLRRCFPVPAFSEFFALFLQIVLDVLLTPVHFSHALTKHLQTSSLMAASMPSHAATGENPVRYKPRLNAGQHIAQHSRTV